MSLTILSLGAGVQSTTMALMAAHGEISPMPHAAIFADTQAEPKAVYDHLDWLTGKLPYPVHVVTAGDLWRSATDFRTTKDGQRSYLKTGIPVYTADGLGRGIGARQCTRDFKIVPINRKIKELAGLARVQKKHGVIADVWIGISADEAMRMKPSRLPYTTHRWPLIELDMDRQDCIDWMRKHGYPEPPRSACTFCPFHDDHSWQALTPAEFADAVAKEKELQGQYERSTALRSVPYFHQQRVPLDQVQFDTTGPRVKPRQRNLFNNECEGMCGV